MDIEIYMALGIGLVSGFAVLVFSDSYSEINKWALKGVTNKLAKGIIEFLIPLFGFGILILMWIIVGHLSA